MKTTLRNLVLLTLPSVVVLGLLIEIFLRVWGYVPYYQEGGAFIATHDPQTVYELRPGFHGLYAGVPVSINSSGFRGAESDTVNGGQTFRIAVVGDSVAFGQGVQDNETLAAQVKKELKVRQDRSVEVINLGVPAYNTCQEYWRFRTRGLSLKPQVVVLVYVSNDTDAPSLQVVGDRVLSPDVKTGLVGDAMASLRKRSYAYNLAWTRWQLVKAGGSNLDNYRQALEKTFDDSSAGWQASKACMSDLATLTRSNNIRLIVIPFPVLGGFDQKPYLFHKYISTVCNAAVAAGAECLDVVPAIGEAKIPLMVSAVEQHPSSQVFAHVAELLARILGVNAIT
jgi:hypothetical protein